MSGPKRDADQFNTLGVIVIGICGAVMVYVTIVALQAFYMNDTSEIQTMADYGGQDTSARSRRADELRNITEAAANGVTPGMPRTYRIRIDGDHGAMELVANDAKTAPDHLVPLAPAAVKTTVKPIFSRGQPIESPAAPAPGAPTQATPAPRASAQATPTSGAPVQGTPAPGAPVQVAPGGHAP